MIDFSWFYYIGRAKLGLTFKETGRMTLCLFLKMYGHYKRTWGLEMRMAKNNQTYEDLYNQSMQDEEWF